MDMKFIWMDMKKKYTLRCVRNEANETPFDRSYASFNILMVVVVLMLLYISTCRFFSLFFSLNELRIQSKENNKSIAVSQSFCDHIWLTESSYEKRNQP